MVLCTSILLSATLSAQASQEIPDIVDFQLSHNQPVAAFQPSLIVADGMSGRYVLTQGPAYLIYTRKDGATLQQYPSDLNENQYRWYAVGSNGTVYGWSCGGSGTYQDIGAYMLPRYWAFYTTTGRTNMYYANFWVSYPNDQINIWLITLAGGLVGGTVVSRLFAALV